MGLLHLPAMAAIPLLTGLLTGIYGGLAAMAALPLTGNQMTLIAIFLLISHNLVQESVIQGKSGFRPLWATLSRLSASCFAVLLVAPLLDADPGTAIAFSAVPPAGPPFGLQLAGWLQDSLWLSIKIFMIITPLMVVLELLKNYQVMPHLVAALRPLLALMGLHPRAGMLWLTGAVFGLSYGGGGYRGRGANRPPQSDGFAQTPPLDRGQSFGDRRSRRFYVPWA